MMFGRLQLLTVGDFADDFTSCHKSGGVRHDPQRFMGRNVNVAHLNHTRSRTHLPGVFTLRGETPKHYVLF